jgi:hypothetical protein
MALIVIYCAWSIYRAVVFLDPEIEEITALRCSVRA